MRLCHLYKIYLDIYFKAHDYVITFKIDITGGWTGK